MQNVYEKCKMFMRNAKCVMQNVLWGYAKCFLMFLFLYLNLPIFTELVASVTCLNQVLCPV